MFTLSYMTEYERFLRKAWLARPHLSDEELYDRFYVGSGIRRDIPCRVRRELIDALGEGLDSLYPSDNLAFAVEDVDFADVLFRMEREFGIAIPLETIPGEIDGTFDSIVRYVSQALNGKGP